MKSKICGVSDFKTLKFLVNHSYPPKFIGFIVNYPKSKRYVKIEKLKKLLSIEKKNTLYVAVLVRPNLNILEKIQNLPFDYYQIYDCSPYEIEEIKKGNDNDNIEVKTTQPAADTPGPSWIDKTGSTGARSLADFGAYITDLGCYSKYDNFGAGATAHGNENLKMNGELLGTEEELKELCGERCYASKDCNYFQTWGGENDSILEKGQPYSCCLYNIPDDKIPKNSDGTPFVGKTGKGKMWKLRNIHNGRYAVFGKSSGSGTIKRVYKLKEVDNIDRESPSDARYRMKEYPSSCNKGSLSSDSSGLSGSEVLDDNGDPIIERFLNSEKELIKENHNTRLIIFILLILGYILYSC